MFSIIKKKTVLTGHIWEGMTDIFSNLLPGTDGMTISFDETVRILSRLESYGIRRLFFTPSVRSDLKRNTAAYLTKCFDRFLSDYRGSLQLRLAGNYSLDTEIYRHLGSGLLTYDNRHVLLEVARFYYPVCFRDLIYEICLNGYIPVISCPERYIYMEKSDYLKMKNRDCLFQLSLSSLSGCYGARVARRSRRLLKAGFYDFVGTGLGAVAETDGFERLSVGRREMEILRNLTIRSRGLWKENEESDRIPDLP